MSWFKNISAYRLGKEARAWTAASVAAKLADRAFVPCGGLSMSSIGWVPPIDGGDLAYDIPGGLIFIALGTEKKVIPPQTIDRLTRERCAELESQQGFKPGRKQRREVKEQVIDDMLPRAFTTRGTVRVWLDTRNGWLVVDTSSGARCDEVFKMLLLAFDKLPVTMLRTCQTPLAAMTAWLETDEAPCGFTVDDDTELQAGGTGGATVRYIHTLPVDDAQRHIAEGKKCTRLAMTWNDRISFVLTESLTLKRVMPLDILKEEGFVDGDLLLMAGEMGRLLADLVDALGGEYVEVAA